MTLVLGEDGVDLGGGDRERSGYGGDFGGRGEGGMGGVAGEERVGGDVGAGEEAGDVLKVRQVSLVCLDGGGTGSMGARGDSGEADVKTQGCIRGYESETTYLATEAVAGDTDLRDVVHGVHLLERGFDDRTRNSAVSTIRGAKFANCSCHTDMTSIV